MLLKQLSTVDIITEDGFLQDVARKGEKLRAGLESALGWKVPWAATPMSSNSRV